MKKLLSWLRMACFFYSFLKISINYAINSSQS